MVFDSWEGIGRIIVVGTLAYAALVILLRVSGKRTLTKLNAFDFVVTVALGSTLATVLLNRSVPLAEGVAALGLLILLQLILTWIQARSPGFQRWVKAEPTLVLHRGRFLDRALTAQRLTREEVLAAMRGSGRADPSAVHAVILETDGSISVIADPPGEGSGSPYPPGVAPPAVAPPAGSR